MSTNKINARIAGALFIIGTVPSALSAIFIKPILNDPNYLVRISANESQTIIGVLLLLLAVAACAGIAISLYPVLRRYNEGLALGAVGFRLIEGVLAIGVAISLIFVLILSQEFVKAGAPDSSYFQTISALIIEGRNWLRDVPMLLVFCIGASMYYYIFFKSKLIPRWLSVWGLVAIAMTIVGSMLVMFHLIDSFGTIQVILNAPIFLQEMVLAVWLIVKGFSPTAIASVPAK